jgi:serine/threonine protein phosphatase PrpC
MDDLQDLPLFWIGVLGFLVVALGIFALRRSQATGRRDSPAAREPSPALPPVSAPPERRISVKPAPELVAPLAPAAVPVIPSFVEEEEEDIDVTAVTASPRSEFPPDEEADGNGDDSPASRGSKVAVMYEDEADEEEVTFPIARILVSAQGQSDRGRVRKRNEDALLVFQERSLFAVADGMGGYAGGEVASALAVDTLWDAFERNVFEGKTDCDATVPRRGRELACAIQMANQAVLTRAKGDAELANMGTTLVAARFSPNKQRVYIGHVGDSRCYRLRGTNLRQLTSDHTMRQLGYKGPGAAHLFQAVGIKPTIRIDLIVDKPKADDIYLLCSDGLAKMVSIHQIRDIMLADPDLEAAVQALIERANAEGGKDNTTVILVKVLERAPRARHE